ncbi:hypothetical protein ACRALDRAFT_2030084 [Sodiomyces alcalophilus JCM 7366]|uniref:uncharacterized protein n=1 Tax=Sodiomyces alcalophilus JCM 7366 TaxID=591952 RepID=UPI0039B41235
MGTYPKSQMSTTLDQTAVNSHIAGNMDNNSHIATESQTESMSQCTTRQFHKHNQFYAQDNDDYTNPYFSYFSHQMHGPDQLPFPFVDRIWDKKERRYCTKNEYPCLICPRYRARTGRRPDFCDVCRNAPDCKFCRHDYPKTGKGAVRGFRLGSGLRVAEYVRSDRRGSLRGKPEDRKGTNGRRKASLLDQKKTSVSRASGNQIITLTYDELDELKDIFIKSSTGLATSVSIPPGPMTGKEDESESREKSVDDWKRLAVEVCEKMRSLTKRMEESDKECIEAHDKMDDLMKRDPTSEQERTEGFKELYDSLLSRQQLLSETARVVEDWSRAMKGLDRLGAMQQTMPVDTTTSRIPRSTSGADTATTPTTPTAPSAFHRHCSHHHAS